MACHETVTCPRCKRTFECRVGTILRCQCQDVVLSEEERYFIQQKYSGCLCADCLRDMKTIYQQPETSS
ncbi:cysteine-rich CWC family protein [Chitinophaga sp. RCC_12]|uniref:cysteine-rich CWC family protein n=1 Tax=Chitinophaga sp. RCC_12 TaxID=3239226 RepID=UPI003524D355